MSLKDRLKIQHQELLARLKTLSNREIMTFLLLSNLLRAGRV